eukprot:COSAG06_NODE_1805_length_8346_cov_13.655875_5_plen_224_part_00
MYFRRCCSSPTPNRPKEKRPELSRRTGGWRSEAPAGWGCPARLLRSSRPVSSQPHVSRPERQVTPPTPAVTRALADNRTISGSTSAPKTPCHRPGSCATPARAGEQWMRGSGARSSGCCGAAPAHWHCVDLAALDNGGRCRLRVRAAEPRKPGERGAPAPQAARAHASLGCEPRAASRQRPRPPQGDSFQEYRTSSCHPARRVTSALRLLTHGKGRHMPRSSE